VERRPLVPFTIYTVIAYWSWAVLFLAWLPGYFTAKRTVRKPNPVSRVIAVVFIMLGYPLLFFATIPGVRILVIPNIPLTPQNPACGMLGLTLDLISVAFAIWARFTIGSNWSNAIALKESHELVQAGPYAIVRHPIYTGLIFAALGLAITQGSLQAYLGVSCYTIGFLIRIRDEEALMAQQFPEAHKTYRMQTRKLIPLVW
jgi:protein-S-isoprenylcysteine O-methyltransferase